MVRITAAGAWRTPLTVSLKMGGLFPFTEIVSLRALRDRLALVDMHLEFTVLAAQSP